MLPYNDYNTYLRSKFGEKVYRIGIDAGFSCPNRDGTKSTGGCIYCDEHGSRSHYAKKGESVADQLYDRIQYLKSAKSAKKFIAYFQAFSNTYASVEKLESVYDSVLRFPGIVGISIGTRPDCVDPKKLALIASYASRGIVPGGAEREVWVELGLQSSHDRTLEALKRGHTYKEFADAAAMVRQSGVKLCVHVILGLPGESGEEMNSTAEALAGIGIDGIKIHSLHVLKGSALEGLYREGKLSLPSQGEYARLVCDFLERLPKDVIVQRLTGQGSTGSHIAPAWALDKLGTIRMIEKEFERRGTRQGVGL